MAGILVDNISQALIILREGSGDQLEVIVIGEEGVHQSRKPYSVLSSYPMFFTTEVPLEGTEEEKKELATFIRSWGTGRRDKFNVPYFVALVGGTSPAVSHRDALEEHKRVSSL